MVSAKPRSHHAHHNVLGRSAADPNMHTDSNTNYGSKRKATQDKSTSPSSPRKMAKSGSAFQVLIPEVWTNIISYLTLPESVALCCASKWFYQFVPSTWSSLQLSPEWPALTGSKFAALACRAGSALREIIIEEKQGRQGRNLLTSHLESIATFCPNIEQLLIKRSCTNVHEFEIFMCQRINPKLSQLKVCSPYHTQYPFLVEALLSANNLGATLA